jgi:hypothetical protein
MSATFESLLSASSEAGFSSCSGHATTFDSRISRQRSFPSRVRSPTPANTEKPPCLSATLLMSSMMRTVLPTPAPPKRPVLPPFVYGSSRSMTLIPVSNISVLVDCCSKVGAGRWIDQRSVAGMSPSLSTGLPMTFITRPSVARPTGTVMGRPRSSRACPDHAVGRLHGDGAHAVLAEVLVDLGGDVDVRAPLRLGGAHADRVEDLRQLAGLELDVHRRSMTWTILPMLDAMVSFRIGSGRGGYSACAPETTSMISFVIVA